MAIELSDLTAANGALAEMWPQIAATAANTRAPFYDFLEQQGAIVAAPAELPSWPVTTTLGHTGTGTHTESGPYTSEGESAQIYPKVQDLARLSESIRVTETAMLLLRDSETKFADFITGELLGAAIRMRQKMAAFLESNAAEGAGNVDAPNGMNQFLAATGTVCGLNLAVAGAMMAALVDATGGALAATHFRTLRDGIFETRGGSFDLYYCDMTQAAAAVVLAASVTVQKTLAPGDVDAPAPLLTGRKPPLEPMCYVDGIPVYGITGVTAQRLNAITIGFERGGYEFAWVQNPFTTAPSLQMVPNSPNAVAILKGHGYARYKNPYRHAACCTGLT